MEQQHLQPWSWLSSLGDNISKSSMVLYFHLLFYILTLRLGFVRLTPTSQWSPSHVSAYSITNLGANGGFTYFTLLCSTNNCQTCIKYVGLLKMCVTWCHTLRSSRRLSDACLGQIGNKACTHWSCIFLTTCSIIWIASGLLLYFRLSDKSLLIW